MRKNDKGSMVVETSFSFVIYVLLILSILGIINVITVQARVHYAMTQTANTVAMYSYILDVLGLADIMVENEEQAEQFREEARTTRDNINDVLNGIMALDIDGFVGGAENIYSDFERWMENPMDMVQLFLNFGVSTAKDYAFVLIARPLMNRYLSVDMPTGRISGDRYLRNSNVVNGLYGLDFHSGIIAGALEEGGRSVLIDKDGNITIYVSYNINYTWGVLPLAFTQISVTQSVTTKAWLGGHGEPFDDGKED
jgi:hypothetical protein